MHISIPAWIDCDGLTTEEIHELVEAQRYEPAIMAHSALEVFNCYGAEIVQYCHKMGIVPDDEAIKQAGTPGIVACLYLHIAALHWFEGVLPRLTKTCGPRL